MDASRFPITTPYGQVPGYELNNGWHRGEDRAMPMDTPVLVNGHEIGLSGNSGQVTGPHLHIGRFVGGHDTAPNGGGFHFASAIVTEVGEDPVNGKFVRIQADGASWVYLHLSRQTVPVGQGLIPIVPAPVPAGPPYSITQVDPYKRDVLAGHQKWDLNQPNFESVRDNPILTLNQQTTITVAAELHHHHPTLQQYLYLLEDPNVPQGYNFKDTVDYVPPAPPYVPPAAPVPINFAEHCILVTTVPFYASPSTAQQHRPKAGELLAGDYFVYKTEMGMKELTTTNGTSSGKWINPSDNVLPTIPHESPLLPTATPAPAPEPMAVFVPKLSDSDKEGFHPFTPERKPITFVLEYDYLFTDLNGYATRLANGKYVAKTVQRHMYDEVEFSGKFFHDGREWARVYIVDKNGDLDKNVWFACPMLNPFTHTPYITPHDKIYEVDTTPAERLSLKHPTPYDKFIQFGATVDVLYSKLHKTIDGFYRQKHK